NPNVYDKQLWRQLGMGNPILVIVAPKNEAEYERIALEILAKCVDQLRHLRNLAVIYRRHHQATTSEIQLQQHQIPYQITGVTSFFSRTEIKDLMAYLRLLINPDDDNALLRAINTLRRKIGISIIKTLANYATQRGIGLLAACSEIGLSQ